jgi:A/G-specific adenine glycosylase
MLQQTRVETVIPYYERFLRRFLTPGALARASQDDVLAAWSGLGYYRRARLLHAGVREVVEHYGGEVPRERNARLSLPGVGKYTAGAIGSIAFDLPEPVLDGNVARVLSRVWGIDEPTNQAAVQRTLWQHAGRLAEGPRPGDLNQGLMELGARVCTPATPRCDRCPLARWCAARKQGRTGEIPPAKPRRAPTPVSMTVAVPTSGGAAGWPTRVWLVQSRTDLFGGLWAPPMLQSEHGDREAAARALAEAGIRAELDPEPSGHVQHVLSHRKLELRVWRARRARSRTRAHRQPVTLQELGEVGIATLTRKVLRTAGLLEP